MTGKIPDPVSCLTNKMLPLQICPKQVLDAEFPKIMILRLAAFPPYGIVSQKAEFPSFCLTQQVDRSQKLRILIPV